MEPTQRNVLYHTGERPQDVVDDMVHAPMHPGAMLVPEELNAKVQAFFAGLAASVRAPHCDGAHRALINEVLKLAQTAELYAPQEKP